jgi:hypothetical protein
MTAAGFPHSGIAGSKPTCGSPTLIAAYRALPRLSVPRHPPCALLSLDRIRSLAARVRSEAIPVHRTYNTRTGALLPAETRFARAPAPFYPTHYPGFQIQPGPGVHYERSTCEDFPPRRAYSSLQKGGDPAAGSPTATLLRLRPSHRARLRPLRPLRVRSRTSGAPNFHGVTGGVYKARERIHRGVADPRLLAIPASCSRVTDCNPNLDRLFAIRSASRHRCALYRPL